MAACQPTQSPPLYASQGNRPFWRALDADGDEHPIRFASPGERLHTLSDIFAFSVDGLSCAEFARGGELGRLDVDGDDWRSARNPRALDGIEADAAAADDDDAGACFHPGRIENGSYPCEHAASDERCAVEGHVLRDCNRLRLVDDHVLGKGASAQAVDNRLAGPVAQRG